MPLGLRGKKKTAKFKETARLVEGERPGVRESVPGPPAPARRLVFHAQLAHGSATGRVEGFSSIQELYAKIAGVFEIEPSEILFCTLNTPRIDMGKLLGGQLGLEDFIFAHVKGIKKEVNVYKSEDSLGLTITDNGVGYAFIKHYGDVGYLWFCSTPAHVDQAEVVSHIYLARRIKDGSTIDSVKTICVGDHIESINGENIVGWRHFEVAKKLKELKKEELFTLQLIEPKKAFGNVSTFTQSVGILSEFMPFLLTCFYRNRTKVKSWKDVNRKNWYFERDSSSEIKRPCYSRRADPQASQSVCECLPQMPRLAEQRISQPSEAKAKAIEKVDDLLELYMGIRDIDLATTMFEAGKDKSNPDEFAVALDETLGDFAFPDEFVFDVWGAIGDVKHGR
ncbi:hypothetical protein A6R68_05060 [Neotoma lepida]|uniref:PDZ domain-containing protein n=1 Tax=Neotoma lepida TaxID=56216 RepID=A0A1A6GJL8_NEOLE|nr:hypothetical protein A6R68_05060 [Neotoma lepida]